MNLMSQQQMDFVKELLVTNKESRCNGLRFPTRFLFPIVLISSINLYNHITTLFKS